MIIPKSIRTTCRSILFAPCPYSLMIEGDIRANFGLAVMEQQNGPVGRDTIYAQQHLGVGIPSSCIQFRTSAGMRISMRSSPGP